MCFTNKINYQADDNNRGANKQNKLCQDTFTYKINIDQLQYDYKCHSAKVRYY